jgi:hypothetical protein
MPLQLEPFAKGSQRATVTRSAGRIGCRNSLTRRNGMISLNVHPTSASQAASLIEVDRCRSGERHFRRYAKTESRIFVAPLA